MQKSIITDKLDRCFLCGSFEHLQEHHALHGSYRALAEKWRLTVPLCAECHDNLHRKGIKDNYLKALAQKTFEQKYPDLNFLKIFGRNFYDD